MKLITLSGLDGSGKSTQIELLKKYLHEQGKSFWYFHAVEFSVANRGEFKNKDLGLKSKSIIHASWKKIQLRKIALLVDIFRFKRLIKKSKVDYIISDRYFYDSVVNICYLTVIARSEVTKQSRASQGKWDCFAALATTVIEKFIPKPDRAFFIKVSPEKIMRRERKPDQGLEYLKEKEKLFEKKVKDWSMIVLDGEKDKEEIFEEIKALIEKYGAL